MEVQKTCISFLKPYIDSVISQTLSKLFSFIPVKIDNSNLNISSESIFITYCKPKNTLKIIFERQKWLRNTFIDIIMLTIFFECIFELSWHSISATHAFSTKYMRNFQHMECSHILFLHTWSDTFLEYVQYMEEVVSS